MNETPETGGFMVAAYVVTAVILLAYTATLVRRARSSKEAGGADADSGRD